MPLASTTEIASSEESMIAWSRLFIDSRSVTCLVSASTSVMSRKTATTPITRPFRSFTGTRLVTILTPLGSSCCRFSSARPVLSTRSNPVPGTAWVTGLPITSCAFMPISRSAERLNRVISPLALTAIIPSWVESIMVCSSP